MHVSWHQAVLASRSACSKQCLHQGRLQGSVAGCTCAGACVVAELVPHMTQLMAELLAGLDASLPPAQELETAVLWRRFQRSIRVLCVSELKESMLGLACLGSRGSPALLANLCMTYSQPVLEKLAESNQLPVWRQVRQMLHAACARIGIGCHSAATWGIGGCWWMGALHTRTCCGPGLSHFPALKLLPSCAEPSNLPSACTSLTDAAAGVPGRPQQRGVGAGLLPRAPAGG
jgi:hypothetical protein